MPDDDGARRELDLLDAGPADRADDYVPAWTRIPRWARAGGAAVAVAAFAVLAVANIQKPTAHSSGKSASSLPSLAATSATPSVDPRPPGPTPGLQIVRLDHAMLGVHAGYELFGLGPDGVVRLLFSRGLATITSIPDLGTTGSVSLIVGSDRVLVRPQDVEPAYVVRDGDLVTPAPAPLGEGGVALPGPTPSALWLQLPDHAAVSLVGLDGKQAGPRITLPAGYNIIASDGAGYLIVSDPSGVYDARPTGLVRITTGSLLAAGRTRWLTLDCDQQQACTPTVTERTTGARSALPGRLPDGLLAYSGLISPDGRTAALVSQDAGGVDTLHLVDLGTGQDRLVAVHPSGDSLEQTAVWSPDSRYLFTVGQQGGLVVVDASSGRTVDLPVQLPPLEQLAIRDAAAG